MRPEFSAADIRALERAAARAWPALRVVTVDGWQVRLSGGGSRRANSVLPLEFDGSDLDNAIDQVERLYRAQTTRCYVQVSSIAQPVELDQRLAERGYVYEEPCVLLAKVLSASAMPSHVTVAETPDAEWLSVYTEPLDPIRRAAVPDVLARVPKARAFLLARRDGAAASSALAVVSPEGIALVECVATRAAIRRSGGAQIIMDGLESWSASAGATRVALQVVESNAAARGLYAKRGYTEVGRYHYRWRDVV